MIAAGGRVSARAEKNGRAREAEGKAAGQCFFWYFSLRQRKVHIIRKNEKTMSLLYSEQMDLFQRLKDKDIDKLLRLSITFKAHKNYEKARIADLLIKIKSQDIKGLYALHKELSRSGELVEADYVDSLLKEKLKIKAEGEKEAKPQKRKTDLGKREEAKKDKISAPESLPGLSEEVYKAMATRIKLNSQRHRERTRGLLSDEDA